MTLNDLERRAGRYFAYNFADFAEFRSFGPMTLQWLTINPHCDKNVAQRNRFSAIYDNCGDVLGDYPERIR